MTTVDWHPFNEDNFPSNNERYLVTVEVDGEVSIEVATFLPQIKEWTFYFNDEVLAWAELPEPYGRD